MAPPIGDAVVIDVLRRVDRLTTPLVRNYETGKLNPGADAAPLGITGGQ